MFHLLSWFGTWQGDELFLEKTSKFTMYFWEVLGFCRESLQVPSAFIFSLFHTPREILDSLIKLGVTDVTFGNDANSGSTVSTVYLSSDWVRPDMHFTIDWFVFLWGDTINKCVESLHRGHIRVRVGAIRILICWAYFPFHGTNFWTLPVINFPANILPFTQRRA